MEASLRHLIWRNESSCCTWNGCIHVEIELGPNWSIFARSKCHLIIFIFHDFPRGPWCRCFKCYLMHWIDPPQVEHVEIALILSQKEKFEMFRISKRQLQSLKQTIEYSVMARSKLCYRSLLAYERNAFNVVSVASLCYVPSRDIPFSDERNLSSETIIENNCRKLMQTNKKKTQSRTS